MLNYVLHYCPFPIKCLYGSELATHPALFEIHLFLWLSSYFHFYGYYVIFIELSVTIWKKTQNYPGGASFQVFRFDLLFFVLVVRLTLSELYASLVSCVHATIQPALSVGRSVGHTLLFFMILFLVECTQLYTLPCRSVGPSVSRSVTFLKLWLFKVFKVF